MLLGVVVALPAVEPTGQSLETLKQKGKTTKKKKRNTRRKRRTIRTILDWIGFGAETRHSFVTRARSLHTTASSQRERDTIRSSSSKQKEIIYHRSQSSSSSSFFLSFFFVFIKIRKTRRETETELHKKGRKQKYFT